MSTAELGLYNITFSIFLVMITLVGSSIPLTISKITSVNDSSNRKDFTNYSVTSGMILSTLTSVFICLAIVVCKPVFVLILGSTLPFEILLMLIPAIVSTAIYSSVRGFLWGRENYFAVSMVEFIEQILRIVFCLLFVFSGIISSPVLAVSIAYSIACLLTTGLGIGFYFRNGGHFQFKKGYYKEIIRSSTPLTAVRFLSSVLSPIIAIILPLRLQALGLSKTMALSELGVVTGMTLPILSIPSTIIGALCMILIPRVTTASKSSNQTHLNVQIKYYLKFTISCVFLFIPVFIALGQPIAMFFFDNQSAGVYLTNASWIIVPMCISQITTSILNALNQETKTFYYFIISNLALLICVTLLPKYVGIQAMLYGSGIGSIILSILNIYKIKKLTHFRSQVLLICLYHTLIVIPITMLVKYVYNIMILIANNFVSICISGLVACVCYLSLLFVFNILDVYLIKDTAVKITTKSIKIKCI